MQENTVQTRRDGILVDQVTHTGGVRTYGTHVCKLSDAEQCGKGRYRFTFPLPYENAEKVEGAMTATVAAWTATALPCSVGCHVSRVSFGPKKLIVEVVVTARSAHVDAINIEGRVVDKDNLGL